MSTNTSLVILLTLESLGLSSSFIYPAFLFGTLTYLLIMFCNLLVLLTVVVSTKLHKPMFILLFNLTLSDMLGATALFPHLVFSIVTQSRVISHPVCVIQAFVIHVYGTGNLLILTAMAYDRYMAICRPLRYKAIMSPHHLIRVIILIWTLNFSLIGTLISLLAQFKVCRTNIVDLYCNNPSLVKLICDDTRVNNYYGLFTIVLIQGGSVVMIIYTYAQILCTCIMTNGSDARQKAIRTCGTHLVVFLILEINTMVALIAHRFENVSPGLRRVLGMSVVIFPSCLDPIIYGLKTKELKQSIIMFLKRNVAATKM